MAQRRLIPRPTGARCPDCGGPVVRGERVLRCAICGFTRRSQR